MEKRSYIQDSQSRRHAAMGLIVCAAVTATLLWVDGTRARSSSSVPAGVVSLKGTFDFTAHYVDASHIETERSRQSDFGDYQTSHGTLVVLDQLDSVFRGRLIWRDRTELFTGALMADTTNTHVNRISISLESLTMNGHVTVAGNAVTIEGIGGGWNQGMEKGKKTVAFWSVDLRAEKVSN